MSKVKNPLFSESAQGDLGGLLFRAGTYGPIVSRRSITPSLRTPAQTIQRARFAAAQQAWTSLTASAQLAWTAMAPPPITGRNLFVGTYSRWIMVGKSGLPTPTAHYHPNIITNVSFTPVDTPTALALIEWASEGDPNTIIAIYGLATYSRRQTPKPSKLVYLTSDVTGSWSAYVNLKCPAPIVHIRIELIDPVNGQVLQKLLYRFTPTWP